MSNRIKALLLDLSGVVFEGDRSLPGAERVADIAARRGWVLRFVTNTATQSAAGLVDKLSAMRIEVEEGSLFTAPMAARQYLLERQLRPYCLVHPAIRPEFDDVPQTSPNCVLMGDARDDLNYASLNRAFRLCMEGAPLIGIGMNRYFKSEDGLSLDAGGFIRAIEWAAEVEAVIMGKPGRPFFEQVVASAGVPAGDCLMVGDDVASDVCAAMEAGIQGCLVKTGKYREGDEARLPQGARCADSLADLLEVI